MAGTWAAWVGDPLYVARRALHTGDDLLTDRQKDWLGVVLAVDEHVEVTVTWWIQPPAVVDTKDSARS